MLIYKPTGLARMDGETSRRRQHRPGGAHWPRSAWLNAIDHRCQVTPDPDGGSDDATDQQWSSCHLVRSRPLLAACPPQLVASRSTKPSPTSATKAAPQHSLLPTMGAVPRSCTSPVKMMSYTPRHGCAVHITPNHGMHQQTVF